MRNQALALTHPNRYAPRAALALAFAVLCALAWASTVRAQTTAPPPTITAPAALAELIDEALANNQELLALKDQARALREEAPYFGSLKDPRLGIGLANVPVDTYAFDQEAMTQKQLFISQQVPWFGTLSLAQQAATVKAVAQDKIVAAKGLEIARQVAEAWYDLGFVARSQEINEQLEAIVTQMLRVAETRYATGGGLQQDILSGQVRLSELLDERVTLTRKQRTLTDRINALLNRESFLAVLPPDLGATPVAPALDPAALTAAALRHNPLIHARRAAIDKAALEVELANKDYLPDMDFRLGYGQRDDDPKTNKAWADLLSASVTFSIPLWQATRQDSKLAASERRLASERKALAALERALPHRIDALVAEIEGSQENHRLFEEALTVQAAQAADSSLAAYSVGRVEFDTMLGARIRLLRFQLRATQYGFEAHKKRAELEEALGGPAAAVLATADPAAQPQGPVSQSPVENTP